MSIKELGRELVQRFLNPVSICAIAWTCFQLWVVFHGSYHAQIQRPIHVAFAVALVFLSRPLGWKKGEKKPPTVIDWLCVAATAACVLYMVLNYNRIVERIPFVNPLRTMDIVVGIVFVVLVIEAGRRAINWAMSIIALAFVAYGFFGFVFPGIFGHKGQTIVSFVETQIYSTTGIFTSPVGVSDSMVFYFLLFGAFLAATPAGRLFTDLARVATNGTVGGSGKASIIASALFGMISGSAPGNVASVGSITYPMMKEQGFPPRFSGSVLAIAGTGGQLIPPIMGAAAFIMVDMIGVSYAEIMKAAIGPSIVYVAALYIIVHLYAVRYGLGGIKEDLSHLKKGIIARLHLLLPVVMLVVLIIKGRSLMFSATWSVVFLVLLCLLKKDTRIGIVKIVEGLEKTAMSAIVVAMPCALAGIIVGEIVHSGLGLRFSSLVAAISQGNLFLALFLTMVMAVILGMGMPTSAAYIMCAVLLGPTMVRLGVEAIVAHFFIFYFANLSMITPPVALSSFAAAGIVGDDAMKLGWQAFKYSFVIFIIPYMFIYNPALLGIGSLPNILIVLVTTLLGTFAIGMALIGHGFAAIGRVERVLLALTAILLIVPELYTGLIGLGGLVVLCSLQLRRKKAAEIGATH